MTKRIFRSILLVAVAVLLASLAIIIGVMYQYFTELTNEQLEVQMALASQGVQDEGLIYFDELDTEGYRITWVSANGDVIYDTDINEANMENHAEREEIVAALEYGVGKSSRYSSTLSEKTIYLARRLNNGTVLRLSVTQDTVFAIMLGMFQPMFAVAAIAVGLSALLAHSVATRIVNPLNTLDLDDPLSNDVYEEISPLLQRIAQQHRRIITQVEAIKRSRDEFDAVTSSMNEGLVVLNKDGVILSMNPAARMIFDADESCIGMDFITVERRSEVQHVVRDALNVGYAEVNIRRNGREYQLDGSRTESGGTVGVILLAFDVTEKMNLEKSRREFTANVSHELKTPLQAIMGSAELMENGLVKPEDMPRFIGRIHSEAARLMTLIEDIIRLSQLDEGGDLPREDVELQSLMEEVALSVRPEAEKRGVSVELEGEDTIVNGVRGLLYELIYNLADNAVKYNVEGGSVKLAAGYIDGTPTLTVSDTGIGIPSEHHDKVFERFYRVDKSHSRATGGTGLGLSIVKHAVQYHRAKLTLVSRENEGTRITVRFIQTDMD